MFELSRPGRAVVITHDRLVHNLDRRTIEKLFCFQSRGWKTYLLSLDEGSDPEFMRELELSGISVQVVPSGRTSQHNGWKSWSKVLQKSYFLRRLRTLLRILGQVRSAVLGSGGYLKLAKFLKSQVDKVGRTLLLPHLFFFLIKLAGVQKNLRPLVHTIRPDVLVFEDLPAASMLLGLRLGPKTVSIVDFHELYPEQAAFPKAFRLALRIVERKVINKAHHIILLSEKIRSYYSRRGLIAQNRKTWIVGNATDVSSLRLWGEVVQDLPVVPARPEKSFVFHGGVTSDRGIEEMIGTFNLLFEEGISLRMFALGHEDYLQELKSMSGRNILWEEVIPQEALQSVIAGSAGIVVPYKPVDMNHILCFPNKVGDSINWKVPFLANEGLEFLQHLAENYQAGTIINFARPEVAASQVRNYVLRPLAPDWSKLQAHFGSETNSAVLGNLIEEIEKSLLLNVSQPKRL